jgi:hypothetical protein
VKLTPVAKLCEVLPDNLPPNWDRLQDPERVVLNIRKGTIAALLKKIEERNLWSSLLAAAIKRPEQWALDLSFFFPHEEKFVGPLVSFLLSAKTEHAKVSWARQAAEWPWGSSSTHLLPSVMRRIEETRKNLSGAGAAQVGQHLDAVIARLAALGRSQ